MARALRDMAARVLAKTDRPGVLETLGLPAYRQPRAQSGDVPAILRITSRPGAKRRHTPESPRHTSSLHVLDRPRQLSRHHRLPTGRIWPTLRSLKDQLARFNEPGQPASFPPPEVLEFITSKISTFFPRVALEGEFIQYNQRKKVVRRQAES